MSFASPLWLAAAAVAVPALLAWLRRGDRRRERDLARFASPRLLAGLAASLSRPKRRAKRALLVVAVALLFVALAEPQAGERWEETRRRGVDVLVALDVSRSMLARDVAPDRLARAKLAVSDLASRLPDDRLGLIAFAGTAFLQCPLTLDHGAFLQSLQALEPGIIPAPGSDLASAIAVAQEALRTEKRNVKLLVLVSDGEDLGGGAVAAAQRAASEGIRVYTIGVGSPAGELIPTSREGAPQAFVKDHDGRYVKSRLDEATLRQVADATGGFYEPLGQRGEGIEAVVLRAIAPIPKEELAARMRRVPVDRYQWPLAAALVLLAAELLVGERRRETPLRWSRRRRRGVAAPPAAAGLLALAAGAAVAAAVVGAPRAALASAAEAQRLFEAGDFAAALAAYRAAAEAGGDDPRLDFNVGAAAYRAGRFDESAAAFARALRSDSPELQEKAFYNLGNAQFRAGETALESDPRQTMQAWQQSLEAYEQALALRPQDEDARHNRDLVRAALEELRQQQQEQRQEREQGREQGQEGKQKEAREEAGEQEPGEQEPGSQDADERRSADGESPHGRPGEQPEPASEPPQDGKPGSADPQSAQRDAAGEDGGGESGEPAPGSRAGGEDARERRQQRAGADAGQEQAPESDGPPEGERPRGPVTAANPESGTAPGSEAAAAAALPGQLGAADARELLDSLRGEEQRVPVLGGGTPASGNGPVRDW